MGRGTVVVGGGQAGVQVALELRRRGEREGITVVGEEPRAPYQRPPLSKEFLAGDYDVGRLAFRKPEYYAEAGIDLLTGERVVDTGNGVLVTDRGRELPYDRIALATGAAPRKLAVPGAGLGGVHHLRDLTDAFRLREELAWARHVVVVGGGFVGLEVAAAARAQGKEVTVVEAADRLLGRSVAPVVSEFYRQAHTRRGTVVRLSASVTGFDGESGRMTGVLLGDGSRVPADLVLVGVGAVPRTDLAERLGLEVDGGIVVDACSRTSRPGVVAAGDCTVRPHPRTGDGRIRLESVPNALAQANAAAAALLGQEEADTSVPWFWSHQGDLTLQIAGLSTGYDHCVVRGAPDEERFSVLYYRQGELLAVDAVNRPADYMAVRRALTIGAHIPADGAADAEVPLKTLFCERTTV
ncbi:NAD(P)/FAD-dependent oxidoreductase [Streptomyces sp. 8ZJF_21]|uniref:NAD(P)/FAD-dependent oxidoreductase n=1 Tax=Streptomyces sp. 8ZJF_21 TaxID=2903141 RepID=UPI001E4CC218|nr:FAD-dependent oxidoreductase [Streptomyces sp. 8ZJF_21]MCD9586856.1 FAD-dependent oxidoreductase [Streptomyces sp. 8ZJF_21]